LLTPPLPLQQDGEEKWAKGKTDNRFTARKMFELLAKTGFKTHGNKREKADRFLPPHQLLFINLA